MSHLHHIATSDITVATDVGPGQEGKTKVFVTLRRRKKKEQWNPFPSLALTLTLTNGGRRHLRLEGGVQTVCV